MTDGTARTQPEVHPFGAPCPKGCKIDSSVLPWLLHARSSAASQPLVREFVDSSSISSGCRCFEPSLRSRAPSLRWRYPASQVVRTHPSSAEAAPCPHGTSVDVDLPRRTTFAEFPCCTLSLCARAATTTPAESRDALCSRVPKLWPSPLLWRVGFRISIFEACSVFTSRCGPRAP